MARTRRDGMTLVEVLVTLAVVGVMATMVVLGLGVSGRGLNAEGEANRLRDRLGLAVDEALVTRRPIALSWDGTGYGFVTQETDGRWIPDRHVLLAERHELPRGFVLGAEAPALIILGEESTGPFEMSLRGADRAWLVAFDGLTATASAVGSGS